MNSLIGLHESGGEDLFDERRGWITFTHELGRDPNNQTGFNYKIWSDLGIGCIARLNHGYGKAGTIPQIQYYADFAQRCANWVKNSLGCHILIIGNETNVSMERPDGIPITWENYLDCFLLCYDKIKAVNPNVLILPAPIGPWNIETGNWLEYQRNIVSALLQLGKLDGGAIHAYTHDYDVGQVTVDDIRHGWQWEFRTYQDQAQSFPPSLPLFITECNPVSGWENVDKGWIVAVFEELTRWNDAHPKQGIRCCCLYRWPLVHDQPQWSISNRPNVVQDLKNAIAIGFPFDEEEPPNGGNVSQDGFENGFYPYNGEGELTVPTGWTPTWIQGTESGMLVRPEFKPAGSSQVRTGTGAVAIHSRNATIDGALYRQFNVTRGKEVEVSGWCLKTENALGGGQQIGIDPLGGVDHTAASVIWSDWYSQYSTDYAINLWRQRSVQCVAQADKITVFLRAKVDYKADGFNSHFDDLEISFSEGPPSAEKVDYELIRLIVQEEIAYALEKLGAALLS